MKQIFTWWSGSSSGDRGIVDYPIIVITPKSTLTRSDNTFSGPIYG